MRPPMTQIWPHSLPKNHLESAISFPLLIRLLPHLQEDLNSIKVTRKILVSYLLLKHWNHWMLRAWNHLVRILRLSLQKMENPILLLVNCTWSWSSFKISFLKMIWGQLKFWNFWSDMIAFQMQALHIELCWLFLWLLHQRNEAIKVLLALYNDTGKAQRFGYDSTWKWHVGENWLWAHRWRFYFKECPKNKVLQVKIGTIILKISHLYITCYFCLILLDY